MVINSSLSKLPSCNDGSKDSVNIYNTDVDNIDDDGPDCLQRLVFVLPWGVENITGK